jgi:UPF0176 protein
MYHIAAFYHFQAIPQDRLEALSQELESLGTESGLRGLIIMATEGVNGTISGPSQESVVAYLSEASSRLGFPLLSPKWSSAPAWPFRRFRIRLRDEIVTLGKPEVQPLPPQSPTHLSPEEWNRVMEEEDVVVLDTRNWYETRIGKFEGALDPNLTEFHSFGEYLEGSGLPREKKVLIYCTGGIRCEKAIVEMHQHGFENVYQLDGGILNYLAKFPNQKFEGECFVFDHRVAVDQNLQPSQTYRLCPHCGQPADQPLSCLRCDVDTVVCIECLKHDHHRTCSKNCANHYKATPGKKGRPQDQGYRYAIASGRGSFMKHSASRSTGHSDNQ